MLAYKVFALLALLPLSPSTAAPIPRIASSATLPTFDIDTASDAAILVPRSTSTFSGTAQYTTTGGVGSCGTRYSATNLVAVLSASQLNKSVKCGALITIKNAKNGKSVKVKVVDTCSSCKSGSLVLSSAAFDKLASRSAGNIPITWSTSSSASPSAKPTSSARKATPTARKSSKPAAKKPTAAAASKPKATPAPAQVEAAAQPTFNGDGTFFLQEGAAGSCGIYNSDSTPIVAVNSPQMNASLCGRRVRIVNERNGKTVVATVADTCPGCSYGSLDLSTGAFDQIASRDDGRVPIQWTWA
ncbi:hypothetical protein JCM10213_005248 [Rhodosporidiobolus nylandii]